MQGKKDFLSLEKDQFREYLNKPDPDKSLEPDGLHSQELRELADAIWGHLITSERSWQAVLAEWKKANVTSNVKNYEKEEEMGS